MASRIIKQGTARASSVRKLSFSDDFEAGSHSSEAQFFQSLTIPDSARKDAAVSEKARGCALDAAEIEKSAYEKGFQQGEKSVKDLAERQLEAVMKRYAGAIFEIGKIRQSLYTQAEREAVKLAIEVAKKIVHREIQVDRNVIQTLVRVALTHIAEKSAVTIHLNPIDYNYLLEQREELSQVEGRDICLLADKSIERGGCLIQTECGDIDARIEEQFQEVENVFFEDMK